MVRTWDAFGNCSRSRLSPIDGNFGSRTQQAVSTFARERQLDDNGSVDDEFWVHLLSSGEMAPQLIIEHPHVVQNSDVSLLV